MNLSQATTLVLEATTQAKIAFALSVFNNPLSNAVKLELTTYQTKMMIEQLEVNSCSLSVNS
jgi:hypothetical protein